MSEELENKIEEQVDAPSSELSKKAGQLSFLEKAGGFFQGNAKYIAIVIGVVVIGFLGWMGYKKFIVEPENVKTAESLFQEESHIVDTQNWDAAINGDSLQTSPGLIQKSKKFDGYAGGNIATY